MSYKVSKDYPRLKQLIDEGHKVVCWVTYDWSRGNGDMVTDIAEAKRIGEGEYMHYMISVRGCCFNDVFPNWKEFDYSDEWMFERWEADNIQFIDPGPSRNTLDLERVN